MDPDGHRPSESSSTPLVAGGELSVSPPEPGPADDEFRQVRERFQLAALATQDLIWDWDLPRGSVTWSGNTERFFSRPPEDHAAWAERVHPEDLAAAEAVSRAALRSAAESWEHEYRFRRAGGEWASILERAYIVRDSAGRAVRVVGAMQDITRRKETEEATIRLAAIVSSSSDAIIGKTLEGVITSWNAGAEHIFGFRGEEIVGRSVLALVPEELHAAERALLERIRRGERMDFFETIRIRKDGRRIDVAATMSPIRDAAGSVIGVSSIKRDITERKRAEEELVNREERYRALVTATTSIVWTTDREGGFRDPQPSWSKYTGQTWEQQRDFGWTDAWHPADRETIRPALRRALEHRTVSEIRGRVWSATQDGYRHVIARMAPVSGADGELREWIGTITDVEDQLLTEERLRHAERLEAVGRLAGGIAHEANNQMTVILGAADFLNRQLHGHPGREDVAHIRTAALRTAAITQQLLAFSRRQLLQPQIIDLNAVVTTLEPILRRALGEVSTLELRLASDLPRIEADPGQLDQVLLNLIFNARDAMPGGGGVTIETANVLLDQAVASEHRGTMPPGRYVRLTVRDSGQGMDSETLNHIFEPFFTTKEVGQGTGLGLATVYGIVKQSNGFVWAHSQPGEGTRFLIYLPTVEAPVESFTGSSTVPAGRRSEVILLAEDEATVRAIVARSLREIGYTVLEAGDGTEALEIVHRHGVQPDLVIADVVMPKMSGRELAARLGRRWPGIPVLFASGYSAADAVGRGMLEGGQEFIQKPLEPGTLALKVRQALDARHSSR